MLEITRGQVGAREHVDLALAAPGPGAGPGGMGHQGLDDGPGGGGIAGLQGPCEVRGRDRHHRDLVVFRVSGPEGLHRHADVRPLGLGQSGGGNPDQVRCVLLAQHAQPFHHVVLGPHDGAHLIHGRGLERDGLAEVAHEEDLAEGGAALGAVQHRDGAAKAEERQGRPDGGAGLERADREGLAALQISVGWRPQAWAISGYGCAERTRRRARSGWGRAADPTDQGAGRRTASHTGLSMVRQSCLASSSIPV